jgi:hypothetical protein
MFDEMSFLFEASSKVRNQFSTTQDTSRLNLEVTSTVANTNNPTQTVKDKIEYDETDNTRKFNKYTITKSSLKENYIRSNVNAAYKSSGKNPYLDLLETFNGEGNNPKSLKIKATDLSYLRDIGVFPINRLMILRRFPEGEIVPTDLNDLDVSPISTIIGWVKADDDLLNFSVNEVWKTQSKWLHELMGEIIQNEFGIDIGGIFPIPGWGQGFMFGLLKRMGLTDYSATDLPIGDANLLREGITRAHEEQGLQSSFNFTLETVYEQKYIGGIDPGAAFNDLLTNSLTMGTSNIRFLGKPGNKLAQQLREANNNPSNPDGWKNLIITTVRTVIDALQGTIKNTLNNNKDVFVQPQDTSKETGDNEQEKKSKESEAAEANIQKIGIVRRLISSVLASTVARYQWPIRGALNQLTGEAATPWHLTIGNPHSPLLSMNNIKVNTLDVALGNELAFNDIPRYMTIKATIEQGRNFGKQEIESMFNIQYKRLYKKV